MVEQLIQLRSHTTNGDYSVACIELRDRDLLELEAEDLPDDWASDPSPSSTARIGNAWIASHLSVGLLVPSVAVPQQQNVLINPNHPDFARARRTVSIEPLGCDIERRQG